ncbi:MAG: type pilus assembly PilZ [Pseudomonas sp.]|nr:type pilus assembly PilZ [Pseudomonas sp.]
MQRDTLLTQDELDFIQNMQHNPHLNVRDASRSLLVNGGAQIQELLTRLAAHEQVTIQAQFDNQQMTFPLHLVEDEFHALHLQLGAPTIFEDQGPMARPWRLVLPEPIALETEKGSLSAMWVHEISFKGILLENRKATKPPKYFALWFAPAGHAPIALRGTFERLTEHGLAAYRLSQRNKQDTERLRQYILQQHQLVHPAPHD